MKDRPILKSASELFGFLYSGDRHLHLGEGESWTNVINSLSDYYSFASWIIWGLLRTYLFHFIIFGGDIPISLRIRYSLDKLAVWSIYSTPFDAVHINLFYKC